MMTRQLAYLLLLLPALLMAGCKKKQQSTSVTKTAEPRPVYITNNTGLLINFRVYNTAEDYRLSQNPLASEKIADGNTYTWVLQNYTGGQLYIDWYSDDYSITNWGYTASLAMPLKITGLEQFYYHLLTTQPFVNDSLTLETGSLFSTTTARSYVILGNQPQTSWKAVDAFSITDKNSVWNTLSADEKTFSLTLTKDMLFSAHAYDPEEHIVKELAGIYAISATGNTSQYRVVLLRSIADQSVAVTPMYSYPYYMDEPESQPVYTKDTLALSSGDLYYIMVREQ